MRINLLVIKTHDIKSLSKFYEKLGCDFLYHKHGSGEYHYSTELDSLVFEIYPIKNKNVEIDKNLRIGFEVSKLDELIKTLILDGTTVIKMPKESAWGYHSVIEDLDGRKIELLEK